MTWNELIRKLMAAGYVEVRKGKGSHRLLKHPKTSHEVWITFHGTQESGNLGKRILREAGLL